MQCSEHGTQAVQVRLAEKQGRFTKHFERFAIAVLQECSTSAASGLLKISWDEADGIKQRAVKRGLERKEELQAIEAIGMDMSAAYRQSVIDNVPDAPEKVVFDRFHIMQHVNESVNEVRREEQK